VNLPRLIVADEVRRGRAPDGLTLVYALKRAGINMKLFLCARDEADVYLLKSCLDEPLVVLDTYTCGSAKNMKNLFQAAADPSALNLVLVSLGKREEDGIQLRPDAMELVQTLSCGIVPVFSAAAAAMLTSNIAMSVLSSFEAAEGGEDRVKGVIFTSVRTPREYQLLEQDYGRRTPILSLGYIPRDLERQPFTLQDLYNPATATRVLQLKSAGMQLAFAVNQIEWQILDALGRLCQEWSPPQEIRTSSKNLRVAIVGDRALSLEGRNGAELFRLLGCEPVDYDPWRDVFPMDAEVIYFPHSMGCFYAEKLLEHEPFRRGIMQSIAANRLVFVNGASAPLFGRHFISPDGEKHKALGVFPFHGAYSPLKGESDLHRVEIRCTADSFITRKEEKLRGYALDYVHISNPGNLVPSLMAYRDIRRNTELGSSGWVKGYCFITDLEIDLWSNVDFVNRWLALRKR
jgi:cobyrinic acid a,c-diamide synthase